MRPSRRVYSRVVASPMLKAISHLHPLLLRRVAGIPNACTSYSSTFTSSFYQDEPELPDPYSTDPLLQGYLIRNLPKQTHTDVTADLSRFSRLVKEQIDGLGRSCETWGPVLLTNGGFGGAKGRRTDHAEGGGRDFLLISPGWSLLRKMSAREGLVSAPYERKHGDWSRVQQAAKLYLFSPSSGLFTCPIAMSDGAAAVLKDIKAKGELAVAFEHLTSRDPAHFWTSGQWMTERRGGSDGTKGISLFYVETGFGHRGMWSEDDKGADFGVDLGVEQSLHLRRLKNKLGTRQLPTAEIELRGTPAILMSEEGRGISAMSKMLTITRLHNAISSAAAMRRITSLATDYAHRRSAFGRRLIEHPLHVHTLSSMEVETRGALLLTLEVARLLGAAEGRNWGQQGEEQQEMKMVIRDEHLLRLLTPIAKLYTAKQAVRVVSEGLECFGGEGYMEETGIPCLLRDTQVLPIWEGTTNVLAMDMVRVLHKSRGAVLTHFLDHIEEGLSHHLPSVLKTPANQVIQASRSVVDFARWAMPEDKSVGTGKSIEANDKGILQVLQSSARNLAYSFARCYVGYLLIDHASWTGAQATDVFAAQRWSNQQLCLVPAQGCNSVDIAMDKELVNEGLRKMQPPH
uniref:acyl-CoA dehydrogenase family member 11-like isoform X3 n=1 Tax=Myxine glutinosa TaxID=7769 RepID=UPI00358E4C8D